MKHRLGFRIFSWVVRLVAIVLVSCAMALSLLLIAQRIFEPFHIVVSDSMSPQIIKGDAIIIKDIDNSTVKVGDIIIFPDPEHGEEGNLIIHRVVGIEEVNNVKFYYTKGDANPGQDNWKVSMGQVTGGVAVRLPDFGDFLDFIASPRGYVSCIVIPAIASLVIASLLGLVEKLVGEPKPEAQTTPDFPPTST